MKLCILVPAYNCAATLPELVARTALPGPDDEIIVVDDASSDETLAVASGLPRVFAVRNATNLGYGGTSRRLYEIALQRGADVTINLHGDLGHRPEDAPVLFARINEGYDLVIGSRLIYIMDRIAEHGWQRVFSPSVTAGMPASRVAGHLGLTWFQNLCFGTRLHSFSDGMRACNRRAIEWAVRTELPSWYSYDGELLLHAAQEGFRISEVGVAPNYDSRAKSATPRIRYGLTLVSRATRGLIQRKLSRTGPWRDRTVETHGFRD